jgi:hypothetical protein
VLRSKIKYETYWYIQTYLFLLYYIMLTSLCCCNTISFIIILERCKRAQDMNKIIIILLYCLVWHIFWRTLFSTDFVKHRKVFLLKKKKLKILSLPKMFTVTNLLSPFILFSPFIRSHNNMTLENIDENSDTQCLRHIVIRTRNP